MLETCAGCSTTYAVGSPACPHCGSIERVPRAGGSVLPALVVVCNNRGAAGGEPCRAAGVRRRVMLRSPAQGVLEVPNLICAVCGLYVIRVEEDSMPKVTRHGGATNAAAAAEDAAAAVVADQPDPKGGEQPSPGNSSSTSSEKPRMSTGPSKPARPKRARTTGSRSSRDQTGGSTAGSTAGVQTAPSSATGSDSEGGE